MLTDDIAIFEVTMRSLDNTIKTLTDAHIEFKFAIPGHIVISKTDEKKAYAALEKAMIFYSKIL